MRIVIAEDHVMFREILRKFCAMEYGAQVVGDVGNGRDAIRAIRNTQPDCVLLDLHLPHGDGFEVADFVRSYRPSTRVLMLSSHCDDFTLLQVERSGAHGFVDKNSQSLKVLRQALDALSKGKTFFSPAFTEARKMRETNLGNFLKILSDRECALLSLMGNSLSDDEIAEQTGISPATVQSHRSHIMRKLGLPNSVKLVQFALQHGFTRLTMIRNGKSVFG